MFFLSARVPLKEKMFFVEHLAVMLKAAIPLDRALSSLKEQARHKGFRAIIQTLLETVKRGDSLSSGLARFPHAFGKLFVSMIEAGEISGKLEESLRRLYTQMKKDYELRSRLKSALIYPAFVLAAMLGIGSAVMLFVVPKLIPMFADFGANLPLPTLLLIAVSRFISAYGIFIALSAPLLVWGIIYLLRGPLKPQFDALLVRLPIFGELVRKINLARFARTLATLLATDILVVDALKMTANVLRNSGYHTAVLLAAEKIGQGTPVAEAFKSAGRLFPPTAITMLQIGEESGTLTDLLDEIATFYEESVEETTRGLSSIIEPILIIILGAAVGGMALAIITPMYALLEKI